MQDSNPSRSTPWADTMKKIKDGEMHRLEITEENRDIYHFHFFDFLKKEYKLRREEIDTHEGQPIIHDCSPTREAHHHAMEMLVLAKKEKGAVYLAR